MKKKSEVAMKRKLIGISCGVLARRYGDIRALEMCADAGFDAVDFNLMHFDVSKDTFYRRSDEEIVVYFELRIGRDRL